MKDSNETIQNNDSIIPGMIISFFTSVLHLFYLDCCIPILSDDYGLLYKKKK